MVLGNPPWERIKLQEQEFFAAREPKISEAPNAAARGRLIAELKSAPEGSRERNLHEEFEIAKRTSEAASVFARIPASDLGRFPLTGRGDVNTYALFAELFLELANARGRAGVIVPTGIATDATTALFFGSIVERNRLVSLHDFQTGLGFFDRIGHARYKFCLLTMGFSESAKHEIQFSFFSRTIEEFEDKRRHFVLSPDQILRVNPNTGTAPVFRTQHDADLTARMYERVPVLIDEKRDGGNTWHIGFLRLLDMSTDSGHFISRPTLTSPEQFDGLVPLYEAKLMHQYDHRWATFDLDNCRDAIRSEKDTSSWEPTPRYLVPSSIVESRLIEVGWTSNWLLGWRRNARSSDDRTTIASFLPRTGVGDSIFLFLPKVDVRLQCALIACLNSLPADYASRQKVGGMNYSYYFMEQLPVLPATSFSESDLAFIVPRVLELTYTSNSMTPFAHQLGYYGAPFSWGEDRRALLRAELDSWFARAYGLSRNDLRYILDPADLLGEDYPSETFRVLKKNEINKYGEYRTQRLVLEAWDRQAAGDLPASELDRIPQILAALPPVQEVNYAGLPDGAWMNRALFPDRDADAYGALAAIVHALQGPTPQDIVRLAYRFALAPKKLTPLLDQTDRALWLRLVGREAQPDPDNVAEMVATVDVPFGQALRTLRSQRAIVEDRATGTWALGTSVAGLDFTAPLESRARFALNAVSSIGMNRLLGSMQPEEIAWLEQRLA